MLAVKVHSHFLGKRILLFATKMSTEDTHSTQRVHANIWGPKSYVK